MSGPGLPTLLEALERRFPDSSRATLRQMLRADRVLVNGRAERDPKRPIAGEDRIEVGPRRSPLDERLSVLHEDADLLVIDKAAGLLTVPTTAGGEESAADLLDVWLGARPGEGRVHVVHRLDRDSSGVLVFAKNVDMRKRLQALFAAHDVERAYVAVVHGRLAEPSGTFRSFLAEDRSLRVRSFADGSEGKEAITHYRTLDAGARYSMLELTLETGRRNQIRVHLAEAGHPIVGDAVYGGRTEDPLGRLGLHARDLGFVHPRSGRRLKFTVPVPESFRTLEL